MIKKQKIMILYVSFGDDEKAFNYEGNTYSSLIDLIKKEFKLKQDSFVLKGSNEDNFFEMIQDGASFEIERSEKDKALERLDGKISFEKIDDIEDTEDFLLVYGFLKYRFGRTPLSWATYGGHLEVVELLLEKNFNGAHEIDCYGETPLIHAVYGGHLEVVELLLEKNFHNAHQADNHGKTPLYWAARKGNLEMVKIILEKNFCNTHEAAFNGLTPLFWAARNG